MDSTTPANAPESQPIGLSATTLKALAIVAMTIDHIAWAFVPTLSVAGQLMHFVGRTTAPIMCFFIAQGYSHTRSLRDYLLRLGIFALVAQVPFSLFGTGAPGRLPLNMLYTLAVGLLAIRTWEQYQGSGRNLRILGLLLLGSLGDWGAYGVVMCLLFHIYRDRPALRNRAFCLVVAALLLEMVLLPAALGLQPPADALGSGWMHLGMLAGLWLITRYNGQRGRPLPGGRWFFYGYYPAHLLALYLLQLWLK